MLADTTAVATVAAKDLTAARRFYGQTLGLPEIGRPDEEVTVYRSGNSTLNVYHSNFAGTNKATAVTWSVGDAFDSVVADLKSKGVRFERYDMPGATWMLPPPRKASVRSGSVAIWPCSRLVWHAPQAQT